MMLRWNNTRILGADLRLDLELKALVGRLRVAQPDGARRACEVSINKGGAGWQWTPDTEGAELEYHLEQVARLMISKHAEPERPAALALILERFRWWAGQPALEALVVEALEVCGDTH